MKKFLVVLNMLAFCASPAAFGADQQNAEQLYKTTYINLKSGKDAALTLKTLIESAKANKLEVKDVLEAAVAKGWMSQEQLNVVMEVAAKNSKLTDKSFAERLAKNQVSATEMQSLANALQGQVTGAAYRCGYYGCYNGGAVAVAFLIILLLALATAPVYFVAY
ncbi:MAG: hypothetical protein HY075_00280 [Deltaproteobacteria bacterium]|nr:hypothetical protein [Deltaproteobacteria bacterium]